MTVKPLAVEDVLPNPDIMPNTAEVAHDRLRATVEALAAKEAEVERLTTLLKDPDAVRVNILRGQIALPEGWGLIAPEVAKAREEQREADVSHLDQWGWTGPGVMQAQQSLRSAPLDSTPLADRIRELESELKFAYERGARAEAAEVARDQFATRLDISQRALAAAEAQVKTLTEERDAARRWEEQHRNEADMERELCAALESDLATEKTAHLATRREADRLREALEAAVERVVMVARGGNPGGDPLVAVQSWKAALANTSEPFVEPKLTEPVPKLYGVVGKDVVRESVARPSESAPCASCVRLREALEREVVSISMDRSWCSLCRTETTGPHTHERYTHPHATHCALAAASEVKPVTSVPTEDLPCPVCERKPR
jgi:hypothetical protein